MTPFEVPVLSVTLNAAGIVPSASNRFPPPNVYRKDLQPERIDQILLDERLDEQLNEICASINVQIWPFLLLDFGDLSRNISVLKHGRPPFAEKSWYQQGRQIQAHSLFS
jgi:hypothetical protein